MSDANIIKQYSINIDFANYSKNKEVTKNIVYSKGDINTAFLHAKLTINNKIINLEGYSVAVNVKNSKGETIINSCRIVDAQKGEVSIPFTTSALSKVGFNKFEVVIYSDDSQITSPAFDFRVADDISSENGIEGTNEYSVLLVLISQVKEILNDAKDTRDRVETLENTVTANEENRKSNELTRIANENIRLSNESDRQLQEATRQRIFDEHISTINNRVQAVDEKLIEVDETISSKLIQVDKDVKDIINVKFDNKVVEIENQIDLTINEKSEIAFSEANDKINVKIDEMSESIKSVDLKIKEVNLIIDENVKKVDDKIVEVNETKSNLINDVNDKIIEVDNTKINLVNTVNSKIIEVDTKKNSLIDAVDSKIAEINNEKNNLIDEIDIEKNKLINDINTEKSKLINTIDNKFDEFEDRFLELESSNVTGEVLHAREDIKGVAHESLKARLQEDFNNKADKESTYTKDEVDVIVQEFASNISKLQNQLSASVTFLSDFINVIKGDSTVYNLKKLSDKINTIKDDLNINENDWI